MTCRSFSRSASVLFIVAVPADPSGDVAEELQNLLSTDFEIGHYLRERVVPHAVLLYTGEGLDEEDDFEEEEEVCSYSPSC